jgi:anti-anti-sigma regulatory factor
MNIQTPVYAEPSGETRTQVPPHRQEQMIQRTSKSYFLVYGGFARFLPTFPALAWKARLILHIAQGWYCPCSGYTTMDRIMPHREAVMLNVTVENIGELAVVECEGKIVQREAALTLRRAVTSQTDARIVVLELSEVHAIAGGGLGMLVFLRQWARVHNIRFLLFNPSKAVRNGLKRIRSISEFYIPTMDEMVALLVYASSRHALAA